VSHYNSSLSLKLDAGSNKIFIGMPIIPLYTFYHTRSSCEKMQLSGCPHFGDAEIQGLFQDFQGPFSVNSRTYRTGKNL
jgi:hypothetical protein